MSHPFSSPLVAAACPQCGETRGTHSAAPPKARDAQEGSQRVVHHGSGYYTLPDQTRVRGLDMVRERLGDDFEVVDR